MSSNREARLIKSTGFGFITAAYLFLLIPFTIYAGNANEFNAPFGEILKTCLPAMIFLVGLIVLIGMLLPAWGYQRYITLLATISILLWLQGNLLVWDYGLLDGRAIDWSVNAWLGWTELGIWASAVVVAMAAHRYVALPILRIAVILFLLQLFLVAFSWFGHSTELAKKPAALAADDSLEKFYRFSSKKNVVHIIADGFQSDIFEEIISEGVEGGKLATALDGFTFFREHLGAFPLTHMSVPAILSGKIYRNHVPIADHIDETIGGVSILSAVHDAGFEVDMAVPSDLAYMYEKSPYTNLYPVPANDHVTDVDQETYDAARLLDLALFRLSPHFLKKRIYNDQLWLIQSFLADKKYMVLRFFSHTSFLKKARENMVVDRQQPVYKLLHLMLSHNPMVTNNDCNYAGMVLPTVRKTVKIQARCGLIGVVNYLEGMKRLGIYDDALIVLMADHGAWVPPKGTRGRMKTNDDVIKVMAPTTMAMSLPLLAVKRPGDSGALKISSAPSWIIDTPATIADVLGLEPKFDGRSVFSLDENEERVRSHFIYQYKRSEWTDDYLSPINEFIVNGSAFDHASWQQANTYFPEGVVEKTGEHIEHR